MFSLIIPAHNQLKVLDRCLQVISLQSEKSLEVLVVNSQANKHSGEIEEKYPQFRFVDIEGVLQAGAARNLGAERATGKYLIFLDSDCLWSEGYFEEIKKLVQRMSDREILTGPLVYEDPSPSFQRSFHAFEFNEFQSQSSGCARFAISSNMIISKDLFLQSGGFRSELPRCQDLCFSSDLKMKMKDVKFTYVSSLKVTHQRHTASSESLLQKAWQHGQTRARVDSTLYSKWSFQRKWWYRFGFPKISFLCFAMVVFRLLRSRYFRALPLRELKDLWCISREWGRGFRSFSQKKGP